MGSGIELKDDVSFRMTKENVAKAEEAIEDIDSMFNWVGYSPVKDDEGNIINLEVLCSEASHSFGDFMNSLAPYVEDNSYVEIESFMEPCRVWFKDGEAKDITPQIIWENDSDNNGTADEEDGRNA